MKVYENEIQWLVYDEFGDILEEKDKEIERKNEKLKKINQYKKKIEELKEIGNLNSPKAQKIIQSLMSL